MNAYRQAVEHAAEYLANTPSVTVDQAAKHWGVEPHHVQHLADQVRNHRAALNMTRQGGSFAGAIGEAYLHADSNNGPRLVAAFPDLFKRYA